MSMDTTHWDLDRHLSWIRQFAREELEIAKMRLEWEIDVAKVRVGLAMVVPPGSPDSRLMIFDGKAYLVKDF